jgi:hypothetical protein
MAPARFQRELILVKAPKTGMNKREGTAALFHEQFSLTRLPCDHDESTKMGVALRTKYLVCGLLVLGFLETGCSTPLAPHAMTAIPTQEIGTHSFIFGNVKVRSPKAPTAWTETDCENDVTWLSCPDGFRLVFLRAEDPTPITYRLTGDGSLRIPLDPGDYFLAEWEWHQKDMNSPHEKIRGAIGASFHVPSGAQATYVGDLTIAFSGRRYAYKVEDLAAPASAAILSAYPRLAGNVTTNLLEVKTPPVAGTRVPICNAVWGARCDDKLEGVEPIEPAQAGSQFPSVPDLAPRLEWKRVGGEGVTYDVVIYEALPYGPPLRMNYVQGPMVDYAEGLATPTYQVKTPLRPRSYYFWSVRLRKGETVSEWSSMSYREFSFLIFALISERATYVPFRFKTG